MYKTLRFSREILLVQFLAPDAESFELKDAQGCSLFTGLKLKQAPYKLSLAWMSGDLGSVG